MLLILEIIIMLILLIRIVFVVFTFSQLENFRFLTISNAIMQGQIQFRSETIQNCFEIQDGSEDVVFAKL